MQPLIPVLNAKSKRVVIITLLLMGCFDLMLFKAIPAYHYIEAYGLLFILLANRNEKFFYSRYIYLYLLFFLISCVYSQLYNGQPLPKTIGFSSAYLGMCFSYYILKTKISYKDIVKILIFLAILYCVGYIIQWLIYPYPLFHGANNDGLSLERAYRIRVAGSICAYMLFFYGFNMYLTQKKIKYLAYSVLGFIPIIIMGFRTLTVLAVLLVFVMVVFIKKLSLKSVFYFVLLGGMALAATQISLVRNKIEEMMERQRNEQTFENGQYIRIIQYDYFTNEFFTKPREQFFGGGVPAGNTRYAQILRQGESDYGLYWVDWGLVGLSWIIGVPAVILLIVMYLHCAWRCKEPAIQFVRVTLILLVVGSLFTTKELYRSGNMLLASFLFCCEYLYNKEKRNSLTPLK